ncbi:MAG TPA: peptidylprolyl isomerase [Acidimicrobiales bacterium]
MNPTRRRAVFPPVVLAGAALLASSCQAGGGYAAIVNGTSVSQSLLLRELHAITANKAFVTSYDQQVQQSNAQAASQGQSSTQSPILSTGTAAPTYTQGFTAVVLNTEIQALLIHDEVVRRHVEPSAKDISGADQSAATEFGGPSVFSQFNSWFRHLYDVRTAESVALAKALPAVDTSTGGIQKFYNDNPQDFISSECVSHILVGSQQLAGSIRAKLQTGGDFGALAKRYSTDTGSAAKGGALGCNPPGQYVAAFEAVADTIAVGQLSQPVHTQFGWHLIKVTSRQLQPLDTQTSQAILQHLQQESPITAYITGVQKTLQVKVNPAYGSWDTVQGGVLPPTSPPANSGLPTTTTAAPATPVLPPTPATTPAPATSEPPTTAAPAPPASTAAPATPATAAPGTPASTAAPATTQAPAAGATPPPTP